MNKFRVVFIGKIHPNDNENYLRDEKFNSQEEVIQFLQLTQKVDKEAFISFVQKFQPDGLPIATLNCQGFTSWKSIIKAVKEFNFDGEQE